MIHAAPGTAFIIEDKERYKALEDIGIDVSSQAERGVGSVGVIHSVSNVTEGVFPRLRHWLFADAIIPRYKIGQRVIFDKFISSDVYFRDEDGNEMVGLKSVPTDCILGIVE